MTHATVKLAVIALPFGLLILAVAWLLRCRHRRELLSADAGGAMGLRCAACGRTRPHPLGGEPVRFHRTQSACSLARPTGIEREAERERLELEEVDAAIAKMERRARIELIADRTRERFGGGK